MEDNHPTIHYDYDNEIEDLENQKIFSTVMFGFKREEVLACIERITAQNMAKLHALETALVSVQEKLENTQEKLQDTEQDNQTLLVKTKEVCNALSAEKRRAEEAVARSTALRAELDKANDETTATRSKLVSLQQETEFLKQDNERLSGVINTLRETIASYEAREQQLTQHETQLREEAQRVLEKARQDAETVTRKADSTAARVIEKAHAEADEIVKDARFEKENAKSLIASSAEGLAASFAILKAQLAAVDERIAGAAQDLQAATNGLSDMLYSTEKSLETFGAQVEQFPQPAAGVLRGTTAAFSAQRPASQPQPARRINHAAPFERQSAFSAPILREDTPPRVAPPVHSVSPQAAAPKTAAPFENQSAFASPIIQKPVHPVSPAAPPAQPAAVRLELDDVPAPAPVAVPRQTPDSFYYATPPMPASPYPDAPAPPLNETFYYGAPVSRPERYTPPIVEDQPAAAPEPSEPKSKRALRSNRGPFSDHLLDGLNRLLNDK